MTLVDALKDKDSDYSHVRVSCGNRWLVWYEDQWQVMESRYRARKHITIIQTDDLEQAVDALISKNNER